MRIVINCTKGLLVTGASSQDNYKNYKFINFEVCFGSTKIAVAASAFEMKCIGISGLKLQRKWFHIIIIIIHMADLTS